jgi:hypothetical protein
MIDIRFDGLIIASDIRDVIIPSRQIAIAKNDSSGFFSGILHSFRLRFRHKGWESWA